MNRLWILIVSLLCAAPATAPDAVRDLLRDRDKVDEAIFIDPERTTLDILEVLPQLDPIRDRELLINGLLFVIGMVGGDADGSINTLLPLAERVAEASGHRELQIGLQIRAARVARDNRRLEEIYRAAIAEMEKSGQVAAEAGYRTELANRLCEWGQTESAMTVQQRAMELSKLPAIRGRVLAINIKIQAMMIYQDLEMRQEAIQILEELVTVCHERGFVYMEGALLHNLGQAQMEFPELRDAAEQTLAKGMAIAKQLNNSYLVNNMRVQQAELLHKRGRTAEALAMEIIAIEEFQRQGQLLRAANSAKHAMRFAAELKRWVQVLEFGRHAGEYFTADFPADREVVQKLLYEAHKNLGHTEEALQHLELSVEQKAATDKKREEEEFHKLAVKFGLDAEKEKSLRLEREKKEEQLVLALVLVLLGLAVAAFYQSRRVAASRQRYQEVMEAIDEGILRFDRSFLIQRGYAPYVKALLEVSHDLAGTSLFTLLLDKQLLPAESVQMLQTMLQACFGEEPLVWQLNEAHLPHELFLGPRRLAVHWTPAYDRHDRLDHVLVTMRDRTAQYALERDLVLEKDRLAAVPEKLSEIFKAGLGRSQALFQATHGLLAQRDDSKEWRRRLHTLKGNARTLGLKQFASQLHRLEDDEADAVELLQQELRNYEDLLQGMTGQRADAISLAGLLSPVLPDFRERIAAAGLAFDQIRLTDGVLRWPEAHGETLRAIIMHGLQNALDHGYLRPQQRGWRPTPFFCEIRALRRLHQLVLEVRDTGAGIDFAVLRRKIHMPQASEAVLIEHLFEDGVSTAEDVTTTSGRGIGLAAIRGLCAELQGTVTLVTKPDQPGVTLLVQIPQAFKD